MARLLLSSILVFLLYSSSLGQDNTATEKVFTIDRFLGMNTMSGDFAVKPGEAREMRNFDLNRNPFSLTKRYGYDTVGIIAGQDSIVSIYAAYYSDGTQQLFIVTDSTGVGYGNIYITAKGSDDVTSLTRIATLWGIQNKTSFTMLRDQVFMVNGQQKGLIWNGDIARSFPLPAPGEPKIVPLDMDGSTNANYYLSGEYRYKFVTIIYHDTTDTPPTRVSQHSYASTPIVVDGGRVLLTGFQFPPVDSILNSGVADSVNIGIYRTAANPGPITEADSVFITGITLWSWASGGGAHGMDSLADIVVIDSMPDSALSTTGMPVVFTDMEGRDSVGDMYRRYGAPSFYASNDSGTYDTASAGHDIQPFGIYYGFPEQTDTLGVVYACTFIDTVSGIESGLSSACHVFNDTVTSGDLEFSYTIGLPRIPDNDTGIVINVYRAMIMQITSDSSYWKRISTTPYTTVVIGPNATKFDVRKLEDGSYALYKWQDHLAVDTVVTSDYYLLRQVPAVDTILTDSIRTDSLLATGKVYRSSSPPLLNSVFSHGDNVFGLFKSALYVSKLDTISNWGLFDYIILSGSDGDENTAAYPSRGVIRVMKNKSTYNVYQDANLQWNRSEVSGYSGCVAPRSLASGSGGTYYYSNEGVVREAEGQYKNRLYDVSLISAPIRALDSLPITERANTVGFYLGQKYMLSIPSMGRTYVYYEKVGGWGWWDFDIAGATLYNTESELNFIPGDTMYFFKGGESVVFKYGSSEEDGGNSIRVLWTSTPILTDCYTYKSINAVGVAVQSTAADTLYLGLISEEGAHKLPGYLAYNNLAKRYTLKGIKPLEQLYWQVELANNYTSDNWDNTIVDRIDIIYTEKGAILRE